MNAVATEVQHESSDDVRVVLNYTHNTGVRPVNYPASSRIPHLIIRSPQPMHPRGGVLRFVRWCFGSARVLSIPTIAGIMERLKPFLG